MEGKREGKILISLLLTVVVSQSLVTLANCRNLKKEFAEQKTYYSPDPHVVSPPSHTISPRRHTHRTPACPPPPQGGSECNCGPSPGSGTTSPPSHGGGGYYNNPPPSPIVGPISPLPPTIPVGPPTPTTPSTPTTPITSPPTPTTPLTPTPSSPSPPFLPVDPNSPPLTPGGTPSPPFLPVDPNSPPFTPGGTPSPLFRPVDPNSPPFTLSTPSPPFLLVDPNSPPFTPGGTPSPPFLPVDPNSPPFAPGGTPGTSIYWRTNPTLVWGIFGGWATVGGLFGPLTTMPFGSNLNVQEALANTRTDGFGALVREGTASYLNSLVNRKFPFSTLEVRSAFISSLVSEKAAADQARVFKLANEGRFKKH